MRVEIVRSETPFRRGEVRNLPAPEGRKLIRQGVAVLVRKKSRSGPASNRRRHGAKK